MVSQLGKELTHTSESQQEGGPLWRGHGQDLALVGAQSMGTDDVGLTSPGAISRRSLGLRGENFAQDFISVPCADIGDYTSPSTCSSP